MTTSKSLIWTGIWTGLAIAVSVIIGIHAGSGKATQFLMVFSIEKLLSMDNLLVMFMIFKYFNIAWDKTASALTYGLLGAIVFRSALIVPGAYIIQHLTWLLYAFGSFLIYAGCKMFSGEDGEYNSDESKIVHGLRWTWFPQISQFVCCIIAIEISDIIFAVDSIPASFGITQDPLIVLPANLLAVLGLRSLYHAVSNGLAVLQGMERYIGAILALVGANVFVSRLWVHIPDACLMAAVFSILCIGVFNCKKETANEKLA